MKIKIIHIAIILEWTAFNILLFFHLVFIL